MNFMQQQKRNQCLNCNTGNNNLNIFIYVQLNKHFCVQNVQIKKSHYFSVYLISGLFIALNYHKKIVIQDLIILIHYI